MDWNHHYVETNYHKQKGPTIEVGPIVSSFGFAISTRDRGWTCSRRFRKPLLYPLSYSGEQIQLSVGMDSNPHAFGNGFWDRIVYLFRHLPIIIEEVGLEPTRLSAQGPKPCASTSSATIRKYRAWCIRTTVQQVWRLQTCKLVERPKTGWPFGHPNV